MKKIRFLTLLGVIVIATTLAGCGNKNNDGDFIIEDTSSQTNDVIKYNDDLVDATSSCIESENFIRNTYDDQNASIEDIKNAIDSTIKECTTAKNNINSIGDWEGDASLKNGILNIIEKYITYYSKFSELLPYISQEEITEEQNRNYESLIAEIEALDNELNQANENLITIQEEFAKNHGFKLETEETYNEEIDNYTEETQTYNEEETASEEETIDEEVPTAEEETPENEIEE